MTNPTSNFGWQMPTPTDLVTDLPADFEVFGQAVDTSMADLRGGTTGQILSKTTNADMDFTWIANDQGDITAVNVTAPITGGGTSGAVTIGVSAASTAAAGVVQLSDSTSTTSSVLASTPTATKSAYDLAAAAVPKSTVTTAGDVIYATGSSAVTRLGIGTAGQVLTVNSGATAPEWATPSSGSNAFYAGKNRIINGDFFVNQRNFSSTTTDGAYGFDRFMWESGAGGTWSAQTFALGTAPVAGYEGKNYSRIVTTGQTGAGVYTVLEQKMESVRTFANQTVTVSFWAKAASGTPKIAPELYQYFGSGGSPSASVSTPGTQVTLSTSWARYSSTITVPSIAGKTLGTAGDFLQLSLWVSAGTTFNARSGSLGIQSNTFDIWGVQVEAGSTATDFQTATGSYGGELALCQRYYYRNSNSGVAYVSFSMAVANSSSQASSVIQHPVAMRAAPTTLDFSNISFENYAGSQYTLSSVVISSATTSTQSSRIQGTISGAVAGHAGYINAQNSTSAYLAVSAEL